MPPCPTWARSRRIWKQHVRRVVRRLPLRPPRSYRAFGVIHAVWWPRGPGDNKGEGGGKQQVCRRTRNVAFRALVTFTACASSLYDSVARGRRTLCRPAQYCRYSTAVVRLALFYVAFPSRSSCKSRLSISHRTFGSPAVEMRRMFGSSVAVAI